MYVSAPPNDFTPMFYDVDAAYLKDNRIYVVTGWGGDMPLPDGHILHFSSGRYKGLQVEKYMLDYKLDNLA